MPTIMSNCVECCFAPYQLLEMDGGFALLFCAPQLVLAAMVFYDLLLRPDDEWQPPRPPTAVPAAPPPRLQRRTQLRGG